MLEDVADHVSAVRNDGPECWLTRKALAEKQLAAGIGRFFAKRPAKAQDGDAFKGELKLEKAEVGSATHPAVTAEDGLKPEKIEKVEKVEADGSAKAERSPASEAAVKRRRTDLEVVELD